MRRLSAVSFWGLGMATALGCGNTVPPPLDASVEASVEGPGSDLSMPAVGPDLSLPPPSVDLLPPPPVITLKQFGSGDGLSGAIIDASPDEAGNIWAVSSDALFVLRPGQTQFRRYTNADGLHIDSVILSVAGGGIGADGVGDAYVGLMGVETGNKNDAPAIREPGKAEHVTLHPDGTITSLHYGDMHTDVSANYWITRSAYRLLYVHTGVQQGHVFMGGNHGITHIFNDTWGDHVHVEVFTLPDGTGSYGLWNGLAIDPATGGLWTCGKMACGLQNWNPDPRAWVSGKYKYAFTVFTSDHALEVPHGYREDFVGAAVSTDGTAWFLSAPFGLARWVSKGYNYNAIEPVSVPGFGSPRDVASDPDGTIWLADSDHVIRHNPQTNEFSTLPLPVSDIRRLYVDTTVTPRAVYISSGDGLVIYRGP